MGAARKNKILHMVRWPEEDSLSVTGNQVKSCFNTHLAAKTGIHGVSSSEWLPISQSNSEKRVSEDGVKVHACRYTALVQWAQLYVCQQGVSMVTKYSIAMATDNYNINFSIYTSSWALGEKSFQIFLSLRSIPLPGCCKHKHKPTHHRSETIWRPWEGTFQKCTWIKIFW